MYFMSAHLQDPLFSFWSPCISSLRRRGDFPPVECLLNTLGAGWPYLCTLSVCTALLSLALEPRAEQALYQSSFKMPVIPWPHSSGPIHYLLVPRADWFKKVNGLDLGLKLGRGSKSNLLCPLFPQNP